MELSDDFKINFLCWKVFGIWTGKSPFKYYKFYSIVFVFILLIIYNLLLTINLFYTPLEVQMIIGEVMYYFNELSVMTKVATMFLWRKEIFAVIDSLNCELFKGNDIVGRELIAKCARSYKICWTINAFLGNFCCVVGPVFLGILYLMSIINEISMPISNYYFLSTETKDQYFGYLYIYQCIGIYSHMMYNVNIDSLLAGLIFQAITQMKVLGHELRSLPWKKHTDEIVSEKACMLQLKYCLQHYESILKFCAEIQDIFSVALFVQFGMSSVIICAILCALLLPETHVFHMLLYLSAMVLQIFVPAWLGTQLISESQNLVFAAYSSEWVPRCDPYKSSVKLFMQRANTPVMIAGMKLFTLNLETFVAIMKTAYSFLTLLRSIQEDN